ncbi:MAG: hypothetical protein ABSG54_11220 [Terriglobia bacterium]
MNRFNKFLAATFLSAAMLLTGAAQAMEIQQYDKMADQDQNEYVGDLVIGAEKVLTDEGRPDQAEQVRKLFTEIKPGDKIPVGVGEFEINLALARVVDAKRIAQDPNATRLEVEHALIVTLKKNGIILPQSIMHVGDNFHPRFPPKEAAPDAPAPPKTKDVKKKDDKKN